jgi:hypothetical protein
MAAGLSSWDCLAEEEEQSKFKGISRCFIIHCGEAVDSNC